MMPKKMVMESYYVEDLNSESKDTLSLPQFILESQMIANKAVKKYLDLYYQY